LVGDWLGLLDGEVDGLSLSEGDVERDGLGLLDGEVVRLSEGDVERV
jgi:hypothetical protein